MQTNVVSIPADATVKQAIQTLLDHRISGAPVVDENRNLVGIVSEFPLLEAVYDPTLKAAPVRRFMTEDVLTVTEDTLVSDVANIFIMHRVRRVPVLADGQLVGLISRRDLLRYVMNAGEELEGLASVTKAMVK